MTQKWEIKYYLTDVAFKSGVYAFKEIITGDRYSAISIAQSRIKYSN